MADDISVRENRHAAGAVRRMHLVFCRTPIGFWGGAALNVLTVPEIESNSRFSLVARSSTPWSYPTPKSYLNSYGGFFVPDVTCQ
jgi:hypothetical protein